MSKIELVGKIGSMALVDKKNNDIDYNKFAAIGRQLHPGFIWVSSGATEIGRLDYINRNGKSLDESSQDSKTDYSAQGQAVLMQTYRQFINSRYSVRQVLVEHYHFNDVKKRQHLKDLLLRAVEQNAVPIINYNDCISDEETRKLEIRNYAEKNGKAYELVDNDETASQIARLVNAPVLLIYTNLDGIYKDVADKGSLIRQITKPTVEETLKEIDAISACCCGASRTGANGAGAKLKYIKPCVADGIAVYIANAEYSIADVLSGRAPSTLVKAGG